MRQGLFTFSAKADGAQTRIETFMGRSYTVVPVVALVEGVLQASNSPQPELALASEFARVPNSWDGRPIVMGHPKNAEGEPIPANSPAVLESYQFGFMFNTSLIENSAGKRALKTEAWIDSERAKEMGGGPARVLERLDAGEQIEVSTGLFSVSMPEIGTYEGRRYDAVWREIIPDHLAFLEEGTLGACSISDGCGAMRANSSSADQTSQATIVSAPTVQDVIAAQPNPTPNVTEDEDKPQPTDTPTPTIAAESSKKDGKILLQSKMKKRYNASGIVINTAPCGCDDTHDCGCGNKAVKLNAQQKAEQRNLAVRLSRLIANSYPDQWTDKDIRAVLDMAITSTFYGYCYLLMFNKDNAIFAWYDTESWDSATFSVPFTLDDSAKVTFTGPATEVVLLTRIVPVQDSETNETPDPDDQMTNPNLSTNEGSTTMTTKKPGEGGTPEAGNTPTNNATPETPAPEANPAPVANAAPATPKVLSAREYIEQAPPEVRAVLEEGLRIQTERKASLVASLKSNNRCEFSEDELKAMDIKTLERLVKMSAVTPNYEGASNGRFSATEIRDNSNDGQVPAPLLVFERKTDQAAA